MTKTWFPRVATARAGRWTRRGLTGLALLVGMQLGLADDAFAGTPTVTMVDAGSGAKQVLKFTPRAGQVQTLTMDLTMGMELSMSGMAMPRQAMPTMRMTMRSTVKEVSANGDITAGFELVDARVVPSGEADPMGLASMMDQQLAKLKGISGTTVVDAHGNPKSQSYNLPEGATPDIKDVFAQMEGSLSQASAPLPSTSVGVGAKWRVDSDIEQQGLSIHQAVTYELLSISGGKAVVGLAIAQSAAPQNVNAPGMPPGASASLVSLSGKGNGKLELDLTKVMPLTSQMDMTTSMEMSMSADGQTMPMSTKIDLNLAIDGTR